MLNLNISYDIEKDTENCLKIFYGKYPERRLKQEKSNLAMYSYLSYSQAEKIKKAQNEQETRSVILEILQKWYDENKLLIKLNSDALNKIWESKKEDYAKGIKKIYNKTLDWPEVSVYLSTFKRWPYNFSERWFIVGIRSGLEDQIGTICHELFHFVFYEYYANYCKDKVNDKQFDAIKEALVYLLNAEPFSKVISMPEFGHATQRELMKFIWKEYSKNPDNFNFQDLLDKAIEQVRLDKNLS